jgi:hypothetical protein
VAAEQVLSLSGALAGGVVLALAGGAVVGGVAVVGGAVVAGAGVWAGRTAPGVRPPEPSPVPPPGFVVVVLAGLVVVVVDPGWVVGVVEPGDETVAA